MEALSANWDAYTRITLDPAANEPIKSEYYRKEIKQVETERELAEDALEKAKDETDRNFCTDWLALMAEQEAALASSRYDVTPEQIAVYCANAFRLVPMTGTHAFFAGSENLQTLKERYIAGQITANVFLSEAEKVLIRIHLENE